MMFNLLKNLTVPHFNRIIKRCTASSYVFETLNVSNPHDHVLHVELNRPESLNAMDKILWREMTACFREIRDDRHCRSVVISGIGRMFTSGLDTTEMKDITSQVTSQEDVARKAKFLQTLLEQYQEIFNSIENCTKPVIAAIHGGCIGEGVDLICACDIRFCTQDAYFKVKEVDAGMAPDMGTLQRLPRIVGNDSKVRELVFRCSKVSSAEAKEFGLVSRVFYTKEDMMVSALELAKKIGTKSPVAVQSSKEALNYSRDHSVKEGLAFMTYWNMTMLQSEDVEKAETAIINKAPRPKYSNL